MFRGYNFGAGPAMLPESVLLKIQNDLLNWRGSSVSILELGHRTKDFQALLHDVEQKLRTVLNISDQYHVLFMPGGGQGCFSLIPMNLTKENPNVDYFVTGIWSERAAKYAKRYANVNVVTESSLYEIPDESQWKLNKAACYAYYCPNETINGVCFASKPDTGTVPLIADMTSSILSEEINVNDYGCIFAAAQKNLGIAGITLLIIRKDLLNHAHDYVPEVFNYQLQVENNSCLNTIPTFPIYVMDLMLDWVIAQGGVTALATQSKIKSTKLYDYIDQSGFYTNSILQKYRSAINIPFILPNDELLTLFLEQAKLEGLLYLQGHKLVGGARASLYNAMPLEGVESLIKFMQKFVKIYG